MTLRSTSRGYFIGGSDARIIMAMTRALSFAFGRKRGEVEPQDLWGNLIVQLGLATEHLNRRWYEANSGQMITDIQKHLKDMQLSMKFTSAARTTSNLQALPSSNRQLITGESAHQSTNRRAVNLPAVPASRRYLVGGSDARVIIGSDEAPLIWRQKRGDKPEALLKCRCYGANASQAPVGSNIEALFCANVAFVLGQLLSKILLSLLLFVSRNKRLRNSAIDKVSSKQLVPSRPQERLR
jgi:hypothetical protein